MILCFVELNNIIFKHQHGFKRCVFSMTQGSNSFIFPEALTQAALNLGPQYS